MNEQETLAQWQQDERSLRSRLAGVRAVPRHKTAGMTGMQVFEATRRYSQEAFGFWFDASELSVPVYRDEPALLAFLSDACAQVISPPRYFGLMGNKVRNHLMRSYPRVAHARQCGGKTAYVPIKPATPFDDGKHFVSDDQRLSQARLGDLASVFFIQRVSGAACY